jgi:hypothetical protein
MRRRFPTRYDEAANEKWHSKTAPDHGSHVIVDGGDFCLFDARASSWRAIK